MRGSEQGEPNLEIPVYIDRSYAIVGYSLYVLVGLIVVVYRAPTLTSTLGHLIPIVIGALLIAFTILSIIGVSSDRRYRLEAWGTTLAALTLAPYAVGAVVTTFSPTVDGGRAAFAGIVFAFTGILWARGLTLSRRAIRERAYACQARRAAL